MQARNLPHIATLLLSLSLAPPALPQSPLTMDSVEDFGRALFFDTDLSLQRTQSCATCHDPDLAFVDPRRDIASGAVSLGADGRSAGRRNTPTLTYAALTPPFHYDSTGFPVGGFFLDGRAATLDEQLSGPLLSKIEMAQPDMNAVVIRVLEKAGYREALARLFGAALLDRPAQVAKALVAALTTFERSSAFSTFDSKYDRYLKGEAVLSRDEGLGRELFFSNLTNCASCHLSSPQQISRRETFTSYRYHNIGVPTNAAIPDPDGSVVPDIGLQANPAIDDAAQAGRFRVPTLRNVAVTGPYMHNGVFTDLHTAVFFYGKYTLNNAVSHTNPETGLPWGSAEIPETVDMNLLRQGQPIDHHRAQLLVAFLRTLTDARFEHLLR
ncbi:MAG: cytochrome c peroxidase [Pseudomonadales bacterium]